MLETCTIWHTFLFYINYIIFYNIWNLLQYNTRFVFDEQTFVELAGLRQLKSLLFHHTGSSIILLTHMYVSQQRHYFSWLKNMTSFVWPTYDKVPITSLFDVPHNSPSLNSFFWWLLDIFRCSWHLLGSLFKRVNLCMFSLAITHNLPHWCVQCWLLKVKQVPQCIIFVHYQPCASL